MQSLSGGLLDTDKIAFSANAQFIAKASQNAITQLTPQEARIALKQMEEEFCKLWDDASGTYRPYGELGRHPPSQYLALQQLKYRLEKDVPIMVAVAAPAGYGKSQLISAWLMYLQTLKEPPKWVVLAVTGVAASNAGGTTVHAFFRLRKNETGSLAAWLLQPKSPAWLMQPKSQAHIARGRKPRHQCVANPCRSPLLPYSPSATTCGRSARQR